MAKHLLFYEDIQPVAPDRHGEWSIRPGVGYGHAAAINACPVMVTEITAAMVDLPVVFGTGESGYSPLAILGIEPGRSLMVDTDGGWTGRYVPAFVRRYPFMFAQTEDRKEFVLCLDEAYSGCDRTGGQGERLFDEAGRKTAFLDRAMEFSRQFEIEQRRTRIFCDLMLSHDLFEPMTAEVIMAGGGRHALTGFNVISRARLKELADDVVMDLFRRDALELVYGHLASLGNLDRLRERL